MRMLRTLLVVAALAALTAATAQAGTYTPRVDRREARQQARIRQGGRSGGLTPRDGARGGGRAVAGARGGGSPRRARPRGSAWASGPSGAWSPATRPTA